VAVARKERVLWDCSVYSPSLSPPSHPLHSSVCDTASGRRSAGAHWFRYGAPPCCLPWGPAPAQLLARRKTFPALSLNPYTAVMLSSFICCRCWHGCWLACCWHYAGGRAGTAIAPGGWQAITSLILSGVLLASSFYNLYWQFVWDQTTDGFYVLLLTVPVIAVIMAGDPHPPLQGIAEVVRSRLFAVPGCSLIHHLLARHPGGLSPAHRSARGAGQPGNRTLLCAPGALPGDADAARPCDTALTARAGDHPRSGLVLPVGGRVLSPGVREPRQLEQPLPVHSHLSAGRSGPGHSRLVRR
jgi:hypothetical protein